MKAYFIKLGDNKTYKTLMKEPLTYLAGAVILAVLNSAHFTIFSSGWGVTGQFANLGAWIYQGFGGDVSGWTYFASEGAQKTLAGGFMNDGASIRNLGIVFGSLAATLFASQFKFKKIKNKKQVFAAIAGGLMMGYGARLAAGCNIGALFTSASALSLSGWVFAAFLLVGAYIGTKLLSKYFM